MPRQKLPARRLKLGQSVVVTSPDGRQTRISVDVGFSRAGKAREIFVDGLKEGSDLHTLATHALILASMALQYGETPETLLASLTRPPAEGDGDTGMCGRSVVTRALEIAKQIEEQESATLAAVSGLLPTP